jgi:hypothetical protein
MSNATLHTINVPGGNSFGPHTLEELKPIVIREGIPASATVVIHTSLGDRYSLVGQIRALCSALHLVECPYCDTPQPTLPLGERKCSRCGSSLAFDKEHSVRLVSEPPSYWSLLGPGIIGLIIFAKIYPQSLGFAGSLALCFGLPHVLMLKRRVAYVRGAKISIRDSPIEYLFWVTVSGIWMWFGIMLLVMDLFILTK